MKLRALDIYPSFRCLCGDCPDTCCAGWDVEIDKAAREKYLRMEGPLGEKAVRALRKEDGEWSFRLEGGRCPFLRDDNLCELQAACGEEALSRTCRLFPRTLAEFGAVREISLSIACPEAARLLLDHPQPLRLTEWETDEPLGYTDVDGSAYLRALALRERLLSLAQNRAYPFPVRLALCVELAADASAALRSGVGEGEALKRYSDPAYLSARAGTFIPTGRPAAGYARLLDTLEGMERLTDRWDGELARMRACAAVPAAWDAPEHEYENLLVYYLFRYFMEAVYDGNFYLPVKLAAASLCLIRLLWQAQPAFPDRERREALMRLYSREVENSQSNLDALLALLRRPSFGSRRILTALLLS